MQETVGGFLVSKLTDDDGGNPFYVWGQDRMWLIQEEIVNAL